MVDVNKTERTKYLGTIRFLNMSYSNTMVFFIVLKKMAMHMAVIQNHINVP